jgi:hypothetical protein
MADLFIAIDGKRKISHLVIADYCEVEESSILKFLHTKAKEFEALGPLTYEKTTFEDEEGFNETSVCYLNPRQTWLLVRYFKKTEAVKDFITTFKSAMKKKSRKLLILNLLQPPPFFLIGLSTTLTLFCLV